MATGFSIMAIQHLGRHSFESAEGGSSHRTSISSVTKTHTIWQNCITPLVLGCILFLIGICCRQLSMLLMNEATILLFVVFILTSLILLSTIGWLVKNHHLDEPHNSANADYSTNSANTINDIFTITTTTTTTRAQDQTQNDNVSETSGPPPDYYTALTNSKPVFVLKANNSCSCSDFDCCYYCSPEKAPRSFEDAQVVVARLGHRIDDEAKLDDQCEVATTNRPTSNGPLLKDQSEYNNCQKHVIVNVEELNPPNYAEAISRQAQIDNHSCKE